MSRLDELYERQLDGELAAAEQAELVQLLAEPAAQRQLARLLALHGALALSGEVALPHPADARAPAPSAAAGADRAPGAPGPRALRLPSVVRGVRRAAPWAALVLLGVAGAVLAQRAMDRSHAAAGVTWTLAGTGAAATVVQGEREHEAGSGTALAPGDRLRGAATLELADGSRLVSGTDTLLETLSGRPGVRLLNGRVALTATPRAQGPPLTVETQFASVEVRGTRYQVVADALCTVVTVDAGTVAVLQGSAPPLLVSAGNGARALSGSASRFTLPRAPWTVDFAAAGAQWSGEAAPGGRAPAFHHRDQAAGTRPVWGVVSPPAAGAGYIALGSGLAVELDYDLPQACDAFILLTIASAADSRDFRANLQADFHLAAGSAQRLTLAPTAFSLRTGEVPLARGDEVVAQAYIMVMESSHQLVVRRFALTPAAP